jgi:hypothetical protein
MKVSQSKKSKSSEPKNGSLVGSEYWLNAAKQIEWQVDHKEKHISVPHDEIDKAKNNLMVEHFCNNGYFIQASIEGIKKEVFNPDIRLKLPAVKIQSDGSLYNIGDRFKVQSTFCELEITYCESKKIHLKYNNRHKHNIIQSEEQITKNLSFGLWIKL